MEKTFIFSRKYDGQKYDYFLNSPSYFGEVGVCGIEITPYISCITPENSFGYTDTVLLNINTMGQNTEYKAYTLHRYMPKWILKKIESTMIRLTHEKC